MTLERIIKKYYCKRKEVKTMYTLTGYRRSDFTTKDGKRITGYVIFLSYPLAEDDSAGTGCEQIYMTDQKLAMCGYAPHVGDTVEVSYNRFGKPVSIFKR